MYFLWCLNCFRLLLICVAANKSSELPPVVHLNRVYPLLETYDSYADYFNIVQPLLLLDAWESVLLALFLFFRAVFIVSSQPQMWQIFMFHLPVELWNIFTNEFFCAKWRHSAVMCIVKLAVNLVMWYWAWSVSTFWYKFLSLLLLYKSYPSYTA